VFERTRYVVTVRETIPFGETILTVTASDADTIDADTIDLYNQLDYSVLHLVDLYNTASSDFSHIGEQ